MHCVVVIVSALLTPLTVCAFVVNALCRLWRAEPAFMERLGIWGPVPRDSLWIHGASVGECLSIQPLLELLKTHLDAPVVLTTTTASARSLLAQYHPIVKHHVWDLWPLVLWHIYRRRPRVWITVESEIWPVWMLALSMFDVPVMLINARISKRSMARWSRWSWLAHPIFRHISYATTACTERQLFLQHMGVQNVDLQGHIKYMRSPVIDHHGEKAHTYSLCFENRRIWMATSVHLEEQEIVMDVMGALGPDVLTIIAPRHMQTVDDWCYRCTIMGWNGLRHSQFKGTIAPHTRYVIVDTMGDLSLFYPCIPVVLVGGSLMPGMGGHNVIEPGSFGCAVVWGPHMENWQDISDDLSAYGFALPYASHLKGTITKLVNNPVYARQCGRSMQHHIDQEQAQLVNWAHNTCRRIKQLYERQPEPAIHHIHE